MEDNELMFDILMMIVSKIDQGTGVLSEEAKLLYKYGMPVLKIPEYLKEHIELMKTLSDRFEKEEEEEKKNEPPKFSFDPGEFRRIVDNEMKDE